ncbi:F0F1 ATP synthase subunit B [Mycolicibacterium sp. S2-37]|uniref:F0F1 ATP synthase subunit B n=1 Tax=Mycolicibacterium sp. S2-37 TaxID=2810297 RepID=UPI001A9409BB|nr:F0F1 ATP synthase subunit B [Mycolicibacterium sp. S2-37]MBO0679753.1 F0F1 ATP synthase subunit B [Mycolicibacterium sp. S2-37]
MVDPSTIILAAEEGGGGSNFLVPNGTFFFVLLIFLILLGVISKFVVPPISKVLNEREAMVTKTAEDNRKSAELFAAAQADSQKVMGSARREAAAIRDKARGEGRQIVEEHRSRAAAESAATLQAANEELSKQGRQTADELQTSIETLSATLASRVLGIDIGSPTSTGQGR